MTFVRGFGMLLLLIAFTACNTTPSIDSNVPVVETLPENVPLLAPTELTPLMRARSNSSQAVTGILLDVRSAMQQGEFQLASSQLERALRIEPRNALVWHYLAQVRFNEGRYSLAASLASKSTLLAQGDPQLRDSNASLIKQAQAAFSSPQ